MIQERVEYFYKHQKFLPDHILFYRDGVSESQYGMVFLDELPQVEAGCAAAARVLAKKNGNVKASWVPGITLLVVGKRHHTRFFPTLTTPQIQEDKVMQAGRDRVAEADSRKGPAEKKRAPPKKHCEKNLKPGLVIDHTIVDATRFSFFLQSHESPLGTAKSGHYIVLQNTSNYTSAALEEVVSMLRNLCMIPRLNWNRHTRFASLGPEQPRLFRSVRPLDMRIFCVSASGRIYVPHMHGRMESLTIPSPSIAKMSTCGVQREFQSRPEMATRGIRT
jgi:hypothetical protein